MNFEENENNATAHQNSQNGVSSKTVELSTQSSSYETLENATENITPSLKEQTESIQFELKPEEELRFEVEQKVTLVLRSGLAEIFGTEISKNKKYVFSHGDKIAVFTWHGCTIELIGKTEVAYVATETPMVFYSNIHGYLEEKRKNAETTKSKGPSVMVVGPTDVGKSTLCRILLNYAVRLGRRPIYVDIDVGQGQISIPGTIAAILVERHADAEEGFSQQAPLVYHFGHTSPGANFELYKTMISELAKQVLHKSSLTRKSFASGIFINTSGWVKDYGYKALIHAASAFEVDLVLVLDQERLNTKLKKDLPNFVNIVLTPKSGGVVERSKAYRANARDARIREYFYGHRTIYYPSSFELKFSDLKIYFIERINLPESCVPYGFTVPLHKLKVGQVTIEPKHTNHILSLSSATKPEDLLTSNVLGFVCITCVDMEQQTITLLSPRPKPLPSNLFLLTDIQFLDIQ